MSESPFSDRSIAKHPRAVAFERAQQVALCDREGSHVPHAVSWYGNNRDVGLLPCRRCGQPVQADIIGNPWDGYYP